jgi:hypothetical protein
MARSASGRSSAAASKRAVTHWTRSGVGPRIAHTAGRGWSDEQLAAGKERLRSRGLIDADGLTEHGRDVRGDIEDRTDAAVVPALAVLGDDGDDLLATIEPWGEAIRDAGGDLTPLVRFTFAT